MKKAIIFDVDGTLWDACQVVADAWNEYLEKFEPDIAIRLTEQDLRSVMGLTMSDIGDRLFGSIEQPRRHQVTKGCFDYEVEYMKNRGGILYPDVIETFEKLSVKCGGTYHLYIVSNCQSGYIEDFIGVTGTQKLIEDLECFGNTGLSKGENIRLLTERNHLDQAVYLGDTEGDYRSTCEAGLLFLHARYGFGKVDPSVPYIDKMEELPEAAEKLFMRK